MPLKHMKKMLFAFMLIFVTIGASAQIVVMNNTNVVRLDMDGDGVWDREVYVGRIPGISDVRTERNFYSELGRVYIINQWHMYERQGVNPANYLPDPNSNADFSQYAGYYMRYVDGMGGMVAPMAGYGIPGNASISVGGKNFGFSVSVPVRNRNNMGSMYTPNAGVRVRVGSTHVGVNVPVSIVTGKNKKQSQTRTVAQPQTRSMTPDEIQQMMNNGNYM